MYITHGLKPSNPWLKHCTKALTVVRKPLSCVIDSMSYQILCVFNQIMSLASRQLGSYKAPASAAQATSAGSISRAPVPDFALVDTVFCAAKSSFEEQ